MNSITGKSSCAAADLLVLAEGRSRSWVPHPPLITVDRNVTESTDRALRRRLRLIRLS